MKTNKSTLVRILSLTGFLLGAFALSAVADTWVAPGCAAPNCNTPAPINLGPDRQVKSGGVNIGGSMSVMQTANPTTGFALDVNGHGRFLGLSVPFGMVTTKDLRISGGDISAGNVLVATGTVGVAEWTHPSKLNIAQSNTGTKPVRDGSIPTSGIADLGSDWKMIQILGSYAQSDNGPAGGYIYKTDTGIRAAFYYNFDVDSTRKCSSTPGSGSPIVAHSLCAKLQGSNLIIETGSLISVVYVVMN
jgi:hypothetical protein